MFSERIQQLCADVSAAQAVSLREFIVYLTGQTEANPGMLNTGLTVLMQETAEEGFAADELLTTFLKLANTAVPAVEQARFAAGIDAYLTHNTGISKITADISSGYPSLKAMMMELMEVAKTETRKLTDVAGGQTHKVDFKSSWNFKGWSTDSTKQKWRKGGIDALEMFSVFSLINYGLFTYREKDHGKDLIKQLDQYNIDSGYFNANGALIKGVVRYHKTLGGIIVAERKFDSWLGEGGRLNFEINRFLPGGFFRAVYQGYAWKARAQAQAQKRAIHETEIESVAESINPRRAAHRIERTDWLRGLQAIEDRYSFSIKKHRDSRSAWDSALSNRSSSGLDDILYGEAKLVGRSLEDSVIDEISDTIEVEDNLIDEV